MKNQIFTLNLSNRKTDLIKVELTVTKGITNFNISGNSTKTVNEAKNKIRSIFKFNRLKLPYGNININLLPSDVKKVGSSYDLPIAISLLNYTYQFTNLDQYIIIGELSIKGDLISILNPIRIIKDGIKNGYKNFILPKSKFLYKHLFPNVNIYEAKHISEVINHLNKKKFLIPLNSNYTILELTKEDKDDLNNLINQESLVRALIIAISGKHSILIKGPVGSGKTISIKYINSLFPSLSNFKSIILSDIQTRNFNFNILQQKSNLVYLTNSINLTKMYGNTKNLGILSQANFGFIVYDEINLFPNKILDNLRFLLDNNEILKFNKEKYLDYPVDFSVIATMNPCPCGKYGTTEKCVCSMSKIERFNKKIDKFLLDRFQIHITIDNPESYFKKRSRYNINEIKNSISKCVSFQENRYKGEELSNGNLKENDISKYIKLSNEILIFIEKISQRYKLSKRRADNLIKIAQTIADLEDEGIINKNHIYEAIQYIINK